MRLLAAVVLATLTALSSRASSEGPGREGHEAPAFILHVPHALTEADRAELAAKGVVIRHALPGNRYLARGAADDARIAAAEPLTAEKKIHPSARREALRARNLAELNVVFHRDVAFEEARDAILAAGGSVDLFTSRFIPSQRIEAKVPPSALEALASDGRVLAVAGPRPFRVATENAASATLMHVSDVHAPPYGLTGEGVAVSLFELGEAQTTHVEFGGRLRLAPTTVGGTSGDRRHATHVAGTIGAAGVRADARGMAPGATIHQFCVRNKPSNSCEGDWLALKDERLAPLGVVADNNSWGWILGWQSGAQPVWHGGDAYWGAYDLLYSAPLDEISGDRGVLFVHSAGNDGALPGSLRLEPWQMHLHVDDDGEPVGGERFCVSRNRTGTDCPKTFCNAGCEAAPHHAQTPFDTIGATASAKNVISVGAVDSSLAIASFSSRGPAKDGRVKPEVVARGVGVLSSVTGDGYGAANGTSMAAPAVTGIAALLTEQWRRSRPGTNPTPAHLKALLIAGTDDIGDYGPDYTYGFGLVNAKASVDLIRNDRVRTLSVAAGQTHETRLTLEEPQHLRIVLNWADPAIPYLGGDDIAAKSLINDLDVKVIDPAGNTILPWTLNKDAVSAPAVRGVNAVDPTEMIDIATAAPGVYRVLVTGRSVMEGPQTAVLVTRLRPAPDLPKRRTVRR